jgi:hypothetical protein
MTASPNRTSIIDLNYDCITNCVEYLTINDIIALLGTCQQLRHVMMSHIGGELGIDYLINIRAIFDAKMRGSTNTNTYGFVAYLNQYAELLGSVRRLRRIIHSPPIIDFMKSCTNIDSKSPICGITPYFQFVGLVFFTEVTLPKDTLPTDIGWFKTPKETDRYKNIDGYRSIPKKLSMSSPVSDHLVGRLNEYGTVGQTYYLNRIIETFFTSQKPTFTLCEAMTSIEQYIDVAHALINGLCVNTLTNQYGDYLKNWEYLQSPQTTDIHDICEMIRKILALIQRMCIFFKAEIVDNVCDMIAGDRFMEFIERVISFLNKYLHPIGMEHVPSNHNHQIYNNNRVHGPNFLFAQLSISIVDSAHKMVFDHGADRKTDAMRALMYAQRMAVMVKHQELANRIECVLAKWLNMCNNDFFEMSEKAILQKLEIAREAANKAVIDEYKYKGRNNGFKFYCHYDDCDKCDMYFGKMKQLRQHIKTKHKKRREFYCPHPDCISSTIYYTKDSTLSYHIAKRHFA